MKKLILLTALATLSAPVLAERYISTKSEIVGNEDGYSKSINQARIGKEFKIGRFNSYGELGIGFVNPDGGDTERFQVFELGTGFKITESLSAKTKFEHKWEPDSARGWKFELGTKFKI